jgi:putative nucleotidyltransferase with HDIG domain
VLSIAFASHIKFPPERLLSLGQGSILHDIGKAKVPLDILNKPDRLTESEFSVIKQHPNYGVEVVTRDNIDDEIIKEVILHHHEDFDGSGYPDRIGGQEMKKYASIVAVADFYDALTSKRVYKEVITPPDAIKMIFNLSGKKFDPRVVNHFVKTVGIYPVGSLVELNDHRIASVVSFSKNDLLKPVVKVLNTDKQEIISLADSKLYIIDVCKGTDRKTMDIFK